MSLIAEVIKWAAFLGVGIMIFLFFLKMFAKLKENMSPEGKARRKAEQEEYDKAYHEAAKEQIKHKAKVDAKKKYNPDPESKGPSFKERLDKGMNNLIGEPPKTSKGQTGKKYDIMTGKWE